MCRCYMQYAMVKDHMISKCHGPMSYTDATCNMQWSKITWYPSVMVQCHVQMLYTGVIWSLISVIETVTWLVQKRKFCDGLIQVIEPYKEYTSISVIWSLLSRFHQKMQNTWKNESIKTINRLYLSNHWANWCDFGTVEKLLTGHSKSPKNVSSVLFTW